MTTYAVTWHKFKGGPLLHLDFDDSATAEICAIRLTEDWGRSDVLVSGPESEEAEPLCDECSFARTWKRVAADRGETISRLLLEAQQRRDEMTGLEYLAGVAKELCQ